jgi:hypothetical protein
LRSSTAINRIFGFLGFGSGLVENCSKDVIVDFPLPVLQTRAIFSPG